jgi:polyisoprenoid-binding protein YceI
MRRMTIPHPFRVARRPAPLAAAILLLATAAAPAQQPPMAKPGARIAARAVAGTYKADPGHTMVTWTVDHMGLTPYTGIFGDVTGTLTFDPKAPNAAKVAMTIPVAKITTPSAALTEHLLRPGKDGAKPEFFGANAADARFVSTRVVARGETATITGNLTLNGITRPVVLAARFYGAGQMPPQMGGGDGLGFTATGTIRRSDFGLGYGVPIVSDAVELRIAAGFMK